MYGRARCGECGQEPASEVGQGGCLCAGRDAADWVVPRCVCKVARQSPAEGDAGARDQLVRAKRVLDNQVRGLLRRGQLSTGDHDKPLDAQPHVKNLPAETLTHARMLRVRSKTPISHWTAGRMAVWWWRKQHGRVSEF